MSASNSRRKWRRPHEHPASFNWLKTSLRVNTILQLFDTTKHNVAQTDAIAHLWLGCLLQDNSPVVFIC